MSDEPNMKLTYGQVKIPPELIQFLRQETYSLLIKGHTGTGKTTLALSILRELEINKDCVYLSTRISPDQIFQYHPWVTEFFNQSKKTEQIEDSDPSFDNSIFIDSRLDESGPLFERITNQLMDVRAPIIIIDTWDAIGFAMDKEALINNVRVLQTWRERAGAKLIFVTEDPDDKTFDFLVDGIVELRQKQYNQRTIREILLGKLRGVRINKLSYLFSVNNSLFHSYNHYQPWKLDDAMYFPPSLKNITNEDLFKNKSHFATGYHELDKLLGGGFPIRSTINIELDHHINAKVALALLSKIIVNFIASQNPLLFLPFEKTGSEIVMQYQKSFGLQKDLVNIISANVQPKKTGKTIGNGDNRLRSIKQSIQTIKRIHQKKHLLSIFGPDIVNLFATTNSTGIADLIELIKSSSDLSIFISRSQLNKQNHLSEISDIRLFILEIDGTLCLQSETPWSQIYAIDILPEKGKGVELEPIV
jgi:KaiC/GvpD/RAD55 family RecA-like ATPase